MSWIRIINVDFSNFPLIELDNLNILRLGSPTECLYKLQTFGINAIHVPINTNTGKIKTTYHHKWLRFQKSREDTILENKPFLRIECPEQADILFGRGWPKMNHPGNAHFRDVIERRSDEYNAVKSKTEKTILSWSIVLELRNSGARFLREDESGFWMEVSNEVARQKVSIGFRDFRKAQLKAIKHQPHRRRPAPRFKRKNPSEVSIDSSEEDTPSASAFSTDGKRHRPRFGCNPKCLQKMAFETK